MGDLCPTEQLLQETPRFCEMQPKNQAFEEGPFAHIDWRKPSYQSPLPNFSFDTLDQKFLFNLHIEKLREKNLPQISEPLI